MNELSWITDDELVLATSRSLPANATVDGETAAAREAFLSLGAALESAAGDRDESALIRGLNATCLHAQEPALKGSLAEDTRRRRWWPLALGGVLAASVAGLFIFLAGTNENPQPIVVAPQPPPPSELHDAHQSPLTNSAIAQNTVSDDTLQADLAWSDPLDDEISLAAATIGQLAGHERGLDQSLLQINDRLEALVQELDSETL